MDLEAEGNSSSDEFATVIALKSPPAIKTGRDKKVSGYKWYSENTKLLIEAMTIEVGKGGCGDNNFKNAQWKSIETFYNRKLMPQVTIDQLQNRHRYL